MKYLAILLLIISLSACNSNHKSDTIIPPPDKEKEMVDSIAKFPDSLLLKEKLIQYYRDNDAYEKALAITNEEIRKDSTNPRLWDIKATLHFENNDTINAIKAYEKAIEIFPDPLYIISLGSFYAQTKNIKALEIADALLYNKNANAAKEAFYIKGLYYNSSGETLKAINFFDNCLALDYTFMPAYREKAVTLYNANKYENAIEVLKKAITLQNSFDEGYYWIGRCLEKLKKNNEAVEAYKMALLYDPDYIEAQDALIKLGFKN